MPIVIEILHPDGPDDVAGLREALQRLPVARIKRLVLLGKTEGPATLNDFSRHLAQAAADAVVSKAGGAALLERTTRIFSTGSEGIASPVTVLLADMEESGRESTASGLALGTAHSESIPHGERAALGHIEAARTTVARAMHDAALTADQVALVLIKSPVLSVAEATRQGGTRARHGGSTGSSRGAASIGAGLALGEIDPKSLDNDPVGRNRAHAQRAMAFSGTEVDRIETIVLGMRPGGDARWSVSSSLIKDLADGDALRALGPSAAQEHVLVLFKAGIAADGSLRGRRTTVHTSDLPADKQLRAAASGVIAACFGGVDAFISGGAEHQGPPGACLYAQIVRKKSAPL
jgi:cyanuric acid amidohydrolase